MSFSPDGGRVAFCRDRDVEIVDAATGSHVATAIGKATSIAWSGDGRRIVVSGTIVDSTTGAAIARPTAAEGPITPSPDTRWLALDTGDQIRLLDARMHPPVATFGKGFTVHASPDGKRVLVHDIGMGIASYDLATGVRSARWSDGAIFSGTRFSEDGLYAAFVRGISMRSEFIEAALLDMTTMKIVGTWHAGAVWFAPRGHRLVSELDTVSSILNPPSTSPTLLPIGPGALPTWTGLPAAFSDDGRQLVTACSLGVCSWDAETGAPKASFKSGTDETETLHISLSPDGTRIAATNREHVARVWSSNGTLSFKVEDATAEVDDLVFSHDGRMLASLGRDSARILDATNGAALQRLVEHGHAVTDAAFSNDDSRLVTSSSDGTTNIWDTKSGKLVASLALSMQASIDVHAEFLGDADHLVALGTDMVVRSLDVAFDDNLDYACQITRFTNKDPAVTELCKAPLQRADARPPRW